MTFATRRVTGLILTGLLAVACSGSPTTSGLPSGVPTLPPIDGPSLSIPPVPSISLIPDQPLEDLFPDTVGGNAVQVTSAQGASVMGLISQDDPVEFNAFLSSIGATVDQISAAFSFGIWPGPTAGEFTGMTMTALRVRNVAAATVMQNMIGLVQADIENAQVSQTTLAGKAVTAVTDPEDAENSVYLYPVGDVVFLVGGTPAYVEEALAQLP